MISIKFLLVISRLCKTERSWELRPWSHKMNLLDNLSTSLHYFCRKWIGATNDNSKFHLRFKGLIMSNEWVCSCRKGNFQSEVSESLISFLYGIVSDFLSSKSKIKLIHFTFYKLLLLKKRPNFHCWLIHKGLRLNLLLCDYCGWPVMPQNGENALYAIPRAVNQICQTLQQLSITLRQRFCRNDLKWFYNIARKFA